jgi:ribosomal protein S18 acetylase RimI-like enzyme
VRIDNPDTDRWIAWDGPNEAGTVPAGTVPAGTVRAGTMHVWRSPDGRNRLFFRECRADAYGPLTAAFDGPCHAQVPLSDEAAQLALRAAGFADSRVEHDYWVPVRPLDAPVPDGLSLITIDEAAPERVMLLDCAIRQDIPGSEGWQPDMGFFRQQTYDEPRDPSAYLIAADGETYVGLVRVWLPDRDGATRRLGCIGVLPGYRNRGLARALAGAVFTSLIAQDVHEVTCEIDDANDASRALFAGLGAVAEGGTRELYRAS